MKLATSKFKFHVQARNIDFKQVSLPLPVFEDHDWATMSIYVESMRYFWQLLRYNLKMTFMLVPLSHPSQHTKCVQPESKMQEKHINGLSQEALRFRQF